MAENAEQAERTPEQYSEAAGTQDSLQPEKPDAPVLSPVTETEPEPPVPAVQEEDWPDPVIPLKGKEARDHQVPFPGQSDKLIHRIVDLWVSGV